MNQMFIIYSNFNALFVNEIITQNNIKNPIIIDYSNSNLFRNLGKSLSVNFDGKDLTAKHKSGN